MKPTVAISLGVALILVLSAIPCHASDLAAINRDLENSIQKLRASRDKVSQTSPYRKIDYEVFDLSERFDYARKRSAGWTPSPGYKIPVREFEFIAGTVFQIDNEGILLKKYAASDLVMSGEYELIFVKNYPQSSHLVDGSTVYCYAKSSGRYSYTSTQGARNTVLAYNYGIIPEPHETAHLKDRYEKKLLQESNALAKARIESDKARQEKLKKEKQEQDLRLLKWHQELSAKGDPYGQLRMAERYRTGDGVSRSDAKAKSLLSLSAAQGNIEAAQLLSDFDKQ